MWAALKSPLLIGADLRHISPAALTILNNPAIIALNQDPLGRSMYRVRVDTNVAKDEYGQGETHVWTGTLSGGDQVVVFLNAANEDFVMEAKLSEMFYHDGPEGSASQVQDEWEVYDLWANRMSREVAKKLLAAKTEVEANQIYRNANWFNSTEISYKDGLKQRDPRLMGKMITTIPKGGKLIQKVERHSVGVYRLKNLTNFSKRYIIHKEL